MHAVLYPLTYASERVIEMKFRFFVKKTDLDLNFGF